MPFPVSPFDIPDIKWKLWCEWAWEIKKMTNYHLRGLYQTNCYKRKSNFSQFFFSHWLLYERFFSFLINVLLNFKNLKILIEIFCQKPKVSKVISSFLDHLKPNFFSRANHGGRYIALKYLDPPLAFICNVFLSFLMCIKSFRNEALIVWMLFERLK